MKWQRELEVGEIALEEFKEVVAASPAEVIIIDVRTNAEAAKGNLQK